VRALATGPGRILGPKWARARAQGPPLGRGPAPHLGMSTQPLLRPEEVAEALAVSKVTVYRLARSGELASVRIRGQSRSRPEALEGYLARCEAPAVPPAVAAVPVAPRPRRDRLRKQWGSPGAA